MLLRDYLNAHAGKTQAVKREELHAYLESKGFSVESKTPYTDKIRSIREEKYH